MARNGILLDDREFKKAMRQYLAVSGKDAVDVVNGKTRDWLFKAAKETPVTRITSARHQEMKNSEKYVSWLCNQVYGKGGWGYAEREAIKRRVKKKRFSPRYMMSGFVKGAKGFKDTGSRPGKTTASAPRYEPVKARPRKAVSSKRPRSSFEIEWTAHQSIMGDSREKQAIAEKAMRKAVPVVVRDMRLYIARKMGKRAKEISV